VHAKYALERRSPPNLRRKWNPHRSSGTEKVAERTGRHQQLVWVGDRHAARWSRAQVRCVVEIVHRRWQRGDVGDIVRAGIIAVEQIEEFDNWRDLPALPCFERAADTQINLDVRSYVELVHGCLDTVDHRAVIGWIAKPVDVH